MRRFAPWIVGSVAVSLLLVYAGLVGLRALYPIAYADEIVSLSAQYALDPALVAAVVRCESRFQPGAVSHRGAIGLMQIMPETGAWIAEQLGTNGFTADDLLDPAVNLRFGAWYLRNLLERFGSLEDALAAYNAGPTRLEDWQSTGEEPYPETSAFVDRVQDSVPIYRVILRVSWLYRIVPALPL